MSTITAAVPGPVFLRAIGQRMLHIPRGNENEKLTSADSKWEGRVSGPLRGEFERGETVLRYNGGRNNKEKRAMKEGN